MSITNHLESRITMVTKEQKKEERARELMPCIDIQLNVKGCKDLEESFQHYVTVETLEGENMYMAEGHGLQDAKKGVIFESFPPVLHLQLKRFEYDFMRDTMVKVLVRFCYHLVGISKSHTVPFKINDRHEFPEEINLDKFCSQSDPNDPYDYVLHGQVLVKFQLQLNLILTFLTAC